MFVRKETAGSIGEHVWEKAGSVIEVADEFGRHLLHVAPREYSEAEQPAPAKKPVGRPPKSREITE